MERARGGVPSVGVVKRRVLRGLWRRLVGVGIIGPGLLGAPASLYFLMGFQSTSKAPGLWWCDHGFPGARVQPHGAHHGKAQVDGLSTCDSPLSSTHRLLS